MVPFRLMLAASAVIALALLAQNAGATLIVQCGDDSYRFPQADVVATGTVESVYTIIHRPGTAAGIEPDQTVVALSGLSFEKPAYRDLAQPTNVTFYVASGGDPELSPRFSQADVGKAYRVELKLNSNGQYNLVCGIKGRQLVAATPTPPLPPLPQESHDFSVSLYPGWNLVSTPVADFEQIYCVKAPCYQPMEARIVSITAPGVKVFEWDATSGKYRDITGSILGANPSNQQATLAAGKSYWFKASGRGSVTFRGSFEMASGLPSTSASPSQALLSSGAGWALRAGWNAVGAPSQDTQFSQLSNGCKVTGGAWGYDATAGKWVSAALLKPGEGYFVKVSGSCTLAAR